MDEKEIEVKLTRAEWSQVIASIGEIIKPLFTDERHKKIFDNRLKILQKLELQVYGKINYARCVADQSAQEFARNVFGKPSPKSQEVR